MEFIKRVIGYVLFIPLIYFYSYILGPILKAVLVPGGVVFLWLIFAQFFRNRLRILALEALIALALACFELILNV